MALAAASTASEARRAIVYTDPETGATNAEHLHDLRGTFATKFILHSANLTDHEIADIMGGSPQQVADVRRVYVDQARVVVAIGQRIRGALSNAL
jgi:hypothetical protein